MIKNTTTEHIIINKIICLKTKPYVNTLSLKDKTTTQYISKFVGNKGECKHYKICQDYII